MGGYIWRWRTESPTVKDNCSSTGPYEELATVPKECYVCRTYTGLLMRPTRGQEVILCPVLIVGPHRVSWDRNGRTKSSWIFPVQTWGPPVSCPLAPDLAYPGSFQGAAAPSFPACDLYWGFSATRMSPRHWAFGGHLCSCILGFSHQTPSPQDSVNLLWFWSRCWT